MFLVKMGQGETAEMAYKLDKKGSLLRNMGEYVQPRNMRFRILSTELREQIGNPNFNVEEYVSKKRGEKNYISGEEIPEADNSVIPTVQDNKDDDVFAFFKTLDSLQELDYIFGDLEYF